MKTQLFFSSAALVLLLALLFNEAFPATSMIAPRWTDQDPKSKHVIHVAQYAVKAHNRQTGESLKFKDVIFAQSQVFAAVTYKVVIVCDDGSANSKLYVAEVREKSWEHFQQLISFLQLPL